ncbi:hypothetical protein [uncultured Phenylobacterium sp.]|uniref:hypothetical protein n=1 Tax=uncultured Phenylobacterium sp. TaxID=349273 RepID=UPI0025ECBD43|nr:hypothetical protein [uncultured Phenylobacterium sp.]
MVKPFNSAALAGLASGALLATSAQAGIVVYDGFEGYGNASILNLGKAPQPLFDQLVVETDGNVDLVKDPDYGIVTPYGQFFSVDLARLRHDGQQRQRRSAARQLPPEGRCAS